MLQRQGLECWHKETCPISCKLKERKTVRLTQVRGQISKDGVHLCTSHAVMLNDMYIWRKIAGIFSIEGLYSFRRIMSKYILLLTKERLCTQSACSPVLSLADIWSIMTNMIKDAPTYYIANIGWHGMVVSIVAPQQEVSHPSPRVHSLHSGFLPHSKNIHRVRLIWGSKLA